MKFSWWANRLIQGGGKNTQAITYSIKYSFTGSIGGVSADEALNTCKVAFFTPAKRLRVNDSRKRVPPRLPGGASLALECPMQEKMRAAEDLGVVQQTDKQQVSGLEEGKDAVGDAQRGGAQESSIHEQELNLSWPVAEGPHDGDCERHPRIPSHLTIMSEKAPRYSRCMPEKEAQSGEGVK
ncbi:hypothetical protein Efla_007130 [Eimeria flavescens]